VRYTDFLKATIFLAAGEGTALAAVTLAVCATQDKTGTLIFALAWWVIAGGLGLWLGRRLETTTRIANLLADARATSTLLDRLWLLAASTVLTAGISWLFPQVAAVAGGGAILIALAWRKQERAVTAIEERDGVRYFVVPGSPFKPVELVRTPGLKRLRSANGVGPA
jgi:hypothetical protein